MKTIDRKTRRFWRDEAGSIAPLAAFLLFALLSVTALALEASNLYVGKLHQQQIATVASLGAANTLNPIVSGQPSAMATATAQQIATINGLSSSDLAVSVTTGSKDQQITANLTSDFALGLGTLLTSVTTVSVNGIASAYPGEQAGDCVRSLQGPANIYNYAVVQGPNCQISAATYLYVCGSANVNASTAQVNYSKASETPYICTSGTMNPALSSSKFTFNKPSVDPLASDSRVTAITARLQAMSAWPYGHKGMLSPSTPSGINAAYLNTTATLTSSTRYGNLSVTGSTLTLTSSGVADTTCTNPLTLSGDLTLAGSSTLTFGSGCYVIGGSIYNLTSAISSLAAAPGASVTLVVKGSITNNFADLTFGNMSQWIAGSISNTQGGNIRYGNGQFVLGGNLSNAKGIFTAGSGPFYFNGGTISNYSSAQMTFGNGPIYLDGGSLSNTSATITFGTGDFLFNGGSVYLNTGSITRFGVGNLNFYGGTAYFNGTSITLGGNGDATNGASSLFFYGGSFTMNCLNLTAYGTTFAFWGGSTSFLGVGTMSMTAPTSSNPAYGYQNMLIYIHGGAFSLYQQNVTDTLSGYIYNPQANISIYGSQTVNVPTGGCLAVIGGIVDIYQSAKLTMTPCTAGSNSGKPSLSQ